MVKESTPVERMQAEVKDEIEKSLFLLDESIEQNEAQLVNKYKQKVSVLIEGLNEKVTVNQKIGAILILVSRIKLTGGDYTYPVHIYGKDLYIDILGEADGIDASPFYSFYQDSRKKLAAAIKKYIGAVIEPELDAEMSKYLLYYNMYFIKILRMVFEDIEIIKKINGLNAAEDFRVLVSELYEKPYLVYPADREY